MISFWTPKATEIQSPLPAFNFWIISFIPLKNSIDYAKMAGEKVLWSFNHKWPPLQMVSDNKQEERISKGAEH